MRELADSLKPPERVDEAWARHVIDQLFDHIGPQINEGFEKAGQRAEAAQFRDIVIPHMDLNIRSQLAHYLPPIFNHLIDWYLTAAANSQGERQIVTKHDDKGRIIEMVKVPIWATVDLDEKPRTILHREASE